MKPFLNNFFNFLHFRRQTVFFAVLGAVFVFGFLFIPLFAHASVGDYVAQALAGLFGIVFQYVLAPILTLILSALVGVAEYNKIINQRVIQNTWATVRDIVNMFFIFAMLLIAFSTILRYQQYEVKKMLPKLVLYAVLVNFSLTICGLFIDLAQVFTLTFVNAFADGAVNNFTTITKVLDYTSLGLEKEGTIAGLGMVLGGYILGLILMVITIVTIGAMLLILLVRIVYLWILSILSPFAFVLPIVPGGQKYASQWWDMFSKQVITGPLLAFFIWLSLTVLANQDNIANDILKTDILNTADAGVKTTGTVVGTSAASAPDFLINYIIAICMMFVGLMLTSQMGGAAGKIAGGASNWMQRSGTGLLTGRLGPTPMRWARERYQSYRGQRESIRKESAQRFGQGVSAIQDKQINARVSSITSGTLGRATSYVTGGRWKAGQRSAERATERYEKHKGKKTSEDINTYSTANRLDLKDDPDKLRELRDNEPNKLRKAAIDMRLLEMRHLGVGKRGLEDEDEMIEIETQPEIPAVIQPARKEMQYERDSMGMVIPDSGKEVIVEEEKVLKEKQERKTEMMHVQGGKKGHISETSEFLNRAPELKQRFDDTMKKTNLKAAMASSIYTDEDDKIKVKEFSADALQGKIDLSALTMDMVKRLDAAAGGQGKYFTELARAIRDTKEMVRIFGSINKDVRTKTMDDVVLHGVSGELKTAFGEATGHLLPVFTKTEVGDDGEEKDVFDADLAGTFLSRKENRSLLEKAHGTSWTKDLVGFMHDNWEKYKLNDRQWDNILEDDLARNTIFNNGMELVRELKGDEKSYDSTKPYGYSKSRLRNTVLKANKSNERTDSAGKVIEEIYEINTGATDEIKKTAKESLKTQIRQNRIQAHRFENASMYLDADKNKRNDDLAEILTAYGNTDIKNMFQESQWRAEVEVDYMIEHYEEYAARLDRFLSDNSLVHLINKDRRKALLAHKAEYEEKTTAEAEVEKKKNKESSGSKPPPTSGGTSPFGV